MKANITLKIEHELLRGARILAAEEGTSISALVAGRLQEAVRIRRRYQEAKRAALAQLHRGFDLNWTPPLSRDELHER